jgi:hypothetical protein
MSVITIEGDEHFGDGKISGRATVDAHGTKSGRCEFSY